MLSCPRLFQEVVVQQQVVGDRTVIYSLLSNMLTTRLEDVKSFQAEFTGHLLQAMEGEKDPRNLLVVFSCVEVILNTLDIPDQHEEVFESLAVDFPVDYRPPGGGKAEGVVTKEQLVMGLRQPISHPKLLEFSLPLFLDKSEAELDSAKCLLAARSDGGSVEEWGKQVEDVWQALKRESMGISRLQPSQDIISATLKAGLFPGFFGKCFKKYPKPLKKHEKNFEKKIKTFEKLPKPKKNSQNL